MTKMEIVHENGKSHIQIELEIKEKEQYQLAMITENHIKGILACKVIFEGNQKKLSYDITNMLSVSKEYENRYMNFEEMKEMFSNIVKIQTDICKYFLDERNLIINPDLIYKDLENGDISLVYLPGGEVEFDKLYDELADFLLKRTDRKDEACVQGVYQFYRMSKNENFSLKTFLDIIEKENTIRNSKQDVNTIDEAPIIDEIQKQTDEDIQNSNIGLLPVFVFGVAGCIFIIAYLALGKNWLYSTYLLIGFVLSIIGFVAFFVVYIIKTLAKNEEDIEIKECSVDEYWGGNEETEIFNEETEVFVNDVGNNEYDGNRLEWKENGIARKYRITSLPVVIGKLSNEVDCRINDSSVSRLHAKILKRDGDIFILDLNSTNGTTVDGERLVMGEERQITVNSNIMLGNVVVRFI